MRRSYYLFYIAILVAVFGAGYLQALYKEKTQTAQVNELQNAALAPSFTRAKTLSGSYLAGRFAQSQYDWKAANGFIGQILAKNPVDPALLKRQMVLAMGSGEHQQAITLAKRLETLDLEKNALTSLFLAVDDFKVQNYAGAKQHIATMSAGGLSDFILPLLSSWADAGMGLHITNDLNRNTIHLYHSILINNFLKKPEQIEDTLSAAMQIPDLSGEDLERIGDVFAHINKFEKALQIYKESLALNPENILLSEKILKLERGEKSEIFSDIKTPQQGAAEALFDMARLLAQEYNDESALVFAQMSAYLYPDLSKNRFLLAALAARNNHYEEAIKAYHSILPSDKNYKDARRTAASLLEEHGYIDEALQELEILAREHKDIEAIIQMGDIYRSQENFARAISAYNRAEKELGGEITADYWHLLYVRGMAYEQSGDWPKAEKDLKQALEYQPSHPYILNYLGYAWADQGINLDQALTMIEKAVALRPNDGYITDSLGWVYFKMNKFQEAVPYLEQAVALMPYDSTVNDHLGDAYWRVGRKLEARFQWERAKNHAEDPKLIKDLSDKIVQGLPVLSTPEKQKNDFVSDKTKKKN